MIKVRLGALVAVAAALVAVLAGGGFAPQTSKAFPANAFITNGTVTLGVWSSGELNVPGGPASMDGETTVGLRYNTTNAEATADGCPCEGWGAADADSSISGSANQDFGPPDNILVEDFVADADSAVSTVMIGDKMRVIHDYHPSGATPNLYEVAVSIENISGSPIHLLYRRVMDWDIEPTAFSEFVTLEAGSAPEIVYTSANGFNSADPLEPPDDSGYAIGEFVDAGPDDHGAHFDFDFGTVPSGFKKVFKTYYGAAGTEVDALAAISAVGADAYSLGQPSTTDGPTLGTPNTFVFAFGEVSSEAVPVSGEEEEGGTDCLPGVPGLPCGDQAGGGDPGDYQPNATPVGGETPVVPTVAPPTVAPPPAPTATPTGGRAGTITAPDTGTGDGTGGGSMLAWLLAAGVIATTGGSIVLAGRKIRD